MSGMQRTAASSVTAATLVTAVILCPSEGRAIDHDNLDSSRPLRIEDAESISFRERAIEFGVAPTFPYRPRRGSAGLSLSAEYLYGFALNTHLSVDFDPYLGSRSRSGDQRFDAGNVGVGVFHNLNRETLSRPAFAVRADVSLPTGRGAQGAGLRLRGIASRTFKQYSRLHVNVDASLQTSPDDGERGFQPAVTVGVSRPFGYPTRFDRTIAAELGARASSEKDQGAVFHAGVGLRQQVTVRSVFDAGITTDFAATKGGASRDRLRLVAGYSTQF
ncbi:MAG: hypothetical protein H7Z41_12870 [Cytophagales bacterium]|nr:hypothetical protein [Armatimonadota bacterium]